MDAVGMILEVMDECLFFSGVSFSLPQYGMVRRCSWCWTNGVPEQGCIRTDVCIRFANVQVETAREITRLEITHPPASSAAQG